MTYANTFDGALAHAVEQYRADGSDEARAAIVRHFYTWLLRRVPYRVTLGIQFGAWVQGSLQTEDASARDRCRGVLGVLSRVTGVDWSAVGQDLDGAHAFGDRTSSPHPQTGLNSGYEDVQRMVASRGEFNHVGDDCFVHSRTLTSRTFFYLNPLRASVLRVAIRAWTRGDATFEAIVEEAQQGVSEQPGLPEGTHPSCRQKLGLLLNEAVDDDVYALFVTRGDLADPSDPYSSRDALTEYGARYRRLAETKLAPPVALDPDVLSFLEGYQGFRRRLRYVVDREPERATGYLVAPPLRASPGDSHRYAVTVDYPFDAIIVPGFTSLTQETPMDAVDPIGAERVRLAARAYAAGLAPMVIVSGAAVYPQGTQADEATLMKDYVRAHPDEAPIPVVNVLRESRARHSTTNLRNALRILRGLHLDGPVLVVTTGPDTYVLGYNYDQAHYLRNPDYPGSDFNERCASDLGYRPHWFIGDIQEYYDARDEVVRNAEAWHLSESQLGRYLYHRERVLAFYNASGNSAVRNKFVPCIPKYAACAENVTLRDPLDP